jgi:hypothetical protein
MKPREEQMCGAICPGGNRASARGGFSMVEVAIATVLLLFALGGLSTTVVSSLRLADSNGELAVASAAVHQVAERLQAEEFATLWARYNGDAADDPGGAGTAPGPGFVVDGLRAVPGDPDGLVGEIRFPDLTAGGVWQLREDVVDASVGMPRDLNADGVVDAFDHGDDYVLLPVSVRLEWRDAAGDRNVEVDLLLAGG